MPGALGAFGLSLCIFATGLVVKCSWPPLFPPLLPDHTEDATKIGARLAAAHADAVAAKRRFVERLHLGRLPYRAVVTSIRPVHHPVVSPASGGWRSMFLSFRGDKISDAGGGVLELYHSVRGARTPEDERVRSILEGGFRLPAVSWANKGPGVYLSSHARYAWRWGGPVVLVCHVDPALPPNRLARYRSEIRSGENGHNGWEYVVANPADVRVAYVLEYKVDRLAGDQPINGGARKKRGSARRQTRDGNREWVEDVASTNPGAVAHSSEADAEEFRGAFVELGQSGCPRCDPPRKRCDCALEPNAHPLDIVRTHSR